MPVAKRAAGASKANSSVMIARWLNALCALIEIAFRVVTVVLLAAIVCMNGMEIVSRSFFSYSFQWIFETNILLASWVYFLGIHLVYHHGQDITLVGFSSLLPQSARRTYERVVQALTSIVFIVAAWYAWTLIELQMPFYTPGVGFPRIVFTVPLLMGLIALALESLRRVLQPAPTRADLDLTGDEP